MERKCSRCNKTLKSDDFICPHCGAILGDPISYSASVHKTVAGKSKPFVLWRWILTVLLVLSFAAAVGLGVFLARQMQETVGNTTVPPTTLPAPTQTAAPLTIYTVQVRTQNKTDLDGTCLHIYSGDQELYSSKVDSEGTATFILPESDGYTIKLTQLPVQYQVHYGDVVFAFEQGQLDMVVTLEEKPVPYTIKVVNTSGEPLPGTCITFYSTGEEEQKQVTDESGCCTFLANYGSGYNSAYVTFTPNGYVAMYPQIGFREGSLSFEIELLTYEEAGRNPENMFTVRVLDEYGEPAPYVSLTVTGRNAELLGTSVVYHSGVTNMEGCFSFGGSIDLQWAVKVKNNVDYYDAVFSFDAGTRRMEIQLDLFHEPGEKFTYTVCFKNQFAEPVPGVRIAVPGLLDGDEVEYYTSDENGMITFRSTESDPSKVIFYVSTLPDDYVTNRPEDAQYKFLSYSRRLNLTLMYEGKVDYTITLLDDQGKPIVGAKIRVMGIGSSYLQYQQTDKDGRCVFRLSVGNHYYTVRVISLPGEYAHLTFKTCQIGANPREITITPEPEDNFDSPDA